MRLSWPQFGLRAKPPRTIGVPVRNPTPPPLELFESNAFAPTSETVAAYLDHLAKQVRSGELDAKRCLLVVEDHDALTRIIPFGDVTDHARCIGLLECAKLRYMTE